MILYIYVAYLRAGFVGVLGYLRSGDCLICLLSTGQTIRRPNCEISILPTCRAEEKSRVTLQFGLAS